MGVLEPLDGWVQRSATLRLEDFYPEALTPFRWHGRLLSIPQNLSNLVVYYNRTLFDRAKLPYPDPKWTWDDFLATAKALTRDTNGDGVVDQYGLGSEASIVRVTPFIWSHGGTLVDDDAAPTRLTLDLPATREALAWFVALQTRHHVVPDRVAESARNHEARFLDGTIGMILDSRRGVPTYRTIRSFEWDVAPLPRSRRPAGLLHADGFFMAAAGRNKPAAWAFIEFANSVEGQELLARTGRTVPSRRSVAESPAFLTPGLPPQSNRVFLDVIPHVRALPVTPLWTGIESMLSEDFERAYHGDVPLDVALRAAVERTRGNFARP
jgi:multiple sugar transport system substrate-binding protein